MPAAFEKLASLRHLLAERFPVTSRPAGSVLATGLPAFDQLTGGLPLSAITEIVCTVPSCGGQLFINQLLTVTRNLRRRVALVDSTNAFDPCSHPDDLLRHLIWIRCRSTVEALQAADLFARDANLGIVVLDLSHAPTSELRSIRGSQWYRFQRAIESTNLGLVVLTPLPSVPSAQLRVMLAQSVSLASLSEDRPQLALKLSPALQRQRLQAATA